MRFEVFLLYKAESDLKEKSVNKVPFEASYCQNDTNMWYSKEDLRKKMPFVLWNFPPLHQKSENPIFTIKSVFYSENRFFTLPDAKRGNFKKQMAFFSLILYGISHIKDILIISCFKRYFIYWFHPQVWLSYIR